MSIELTIQNMKDIIDRKLLNLCAEIYDLTISAQVALKIGNTKYTEELQKNLEILEKSKIEFENIKNNLI